MGTPIFSPFILSPGTPAAGKVPKSNSNMEHISLQKRGTERTQQHFFRRLHETVHDVRVRPPKMQNGNGECLGESSSMPHFSACASRMTAVDDFHTPDLSSSFHSLSNLSNEQISRKRAAYQPETARIRPWEGRIKKRQLIPRRSNDSLLASNSVMSESNSMSVDCGAQDDFVDVDGNDGCSVSSEAGSHRVSDTGELEKDLTKSADHRKDEVTKLRSKLFAAKIELSQLRQNEFKMKQALDENELLRNELETAYCRIKQLESLIIDRNLRLKQMLSENLMQSVKLKRLRAEVGEDVFDTIAKM